MSSSEIDIYAEQAHTLVDRVIECALKKLDEEEMQNPPRERTQTSIKFDLSREVTEDDDEPPEPKYDTYDQENIEWLTIEQFSVQKAEQKIKEFIEKWEFQDSWLCCIDYLGEDEHKFDLRHRFRVRWSIPTRRKPIPRATASVYFTFDVSKIKPKTYPVQIYYVFETNRLVHRPGQSRFREKWLKDIIESKVITMQAVDF